MNILSVNFLQGHRDTPSFNFTRNVNCLIERHEGSRWRREEGGEGGRKGKGKKGRTNDLLSLTLSSSAVLR